MFRSGKRFLFLHAAKYQPRLSPGGNRLLGLAARDRSDYLNGHGRRGRIRTGPNHQGGGRSYDTLLKDSGHGTTLAPNIRNEVDPESNRRRTGHAFRVFRRGRNVSARHRGRGCGCRYAVLVPCLLPPTERHVNYIFSSRITSACTGTLADPHVPRPLQPQFRGRRRLGPNTRSC